MNDSDTLEEAIGAENIELLLQFAAEELQSFSRQITFLSLDPSKDFRFADLSFVSFDNTDLRGFDFTGANLIGTTGVGAKWDNTTKLDGAILSGSIFAFERSSAKWIASNPKGRLEFEKLKKSHWTKSILWISDNVAKHSADRVAAVEVAKALFEATNDNLIRSNILYFLSYAFDSRAEHQDFLIHTINKYSNAPKIVRSAVTVMSSIFTDDSISIGILLALGSDTNTSPDIRRIALRGVINSSKYSDTLRFITNDKALYAVDLRRHYTRRVASIRGHFAINCVTEPIGDVCIDFLQTVPLQKVIDISRKILRQTKLERYRTSKDKSGKYNFEPNYYEYMDLAATIRGELIAIKRLGLPLEIDPAVLSLTRPDYVEFLNMPTDTP